MTAMWFKPKDIGFAEGFYAGWGNFGSAAAAMSLPAIAIHAFGGPEGWRWAIASSAIIMAVYGVYYWFALTDGPAGTVHRKPHKASALEVSTWADMVKLIIWTIPMVGVLGILVWRIEGLGYLGSTGAMISLRGDRPGGDLPDRADPAGQRTDPEKGVPEDDKYPFNTVAALNSTYFANFGAELAVVSMLPMFFEQTWG